MDTQLLTWGTRVLVQGKPYTVCNGGQYDQTRVELIGDDGETWSGSIATVHDTGATPAEITRLIWGVSWTYEKTTR